MPKIVTISLVITVVLLILFGLGRQIISALDAGKRLDLAIDEVSKLQQKNQELKQKLTQAKSQDTLEQTLRDKLNMAKPNETIVVIPKEAIDRVLGANKVIEEIKIPNWQGWLRLFIH